MKLNRFQDASQFYEQAKDYLLSHEAQHNLLLGISRALIRNPEQYNCQPYLALTADELHLCIHLPSIAKKVMPLPVWQH